MVVIRKNGKMVVYFKSSEKPNTDIENTSQENVEDKTESDDSEFRRSQKNPVEDSQIRTQRNGESINNSDEQKRIRRLINSEQKR